MTFPDLSLDGAWTVTAISGPVPDDLRDREVAATVPGCIHLDLLAAGRIRDPFDGDNEAAQQWIGDTVWRYSRTFLWEPTPAERHDLVAAGLDTLATVTLNGTVVAQTANQNRSYRWSVGHLLREGENRIEVTFDAPVPAAERAERENGGKRFHVNHHPYNALRKTASNFGWDWGIDAATSGIWKSIGIQSWSGVRIDSVRPLVDVTGTTGLLSAHVQLDGVGIPQWHDVTVVVRRDGAEVARAVAEVRGSGVVGVAVPDVDLWWPRGHGSPALYDVEVHAGDDVWAHEIGFRTVSLVTEADRWGSAFELRVNGRLVQVRGANWIPDDAFVPRISRERIERRVADATEANMNLLRIWGGGMYESDDLYQICSREGVLVWQDFLLACAAYAEEPWLADEIEAEAREAVTRLSAHPSLVIWSGNNENLVGYADWGWRAQLEGRTWGEGYYTELLPGIVAELDPTRPYIPGSPYSPSALLPPNAPTDGTVHIWDVWNTKDYREYAGWRPRFVAEFGFQGPPAYTTLFDVVHDEPLHPGGHDLLVHQKAEDGNGKLERGYAGHFPPPRTIDDWHLTTQINQAHAVRFGISWFRSLAPLNTGTIVWQLNDDWPVVSWAAVDWKERRKPLWYALRDVYASRFAAFRPREEHEEGADALRLVVLNDTGEPLSTGVRFARLAFDGTELASADAHATVDPRGVASLPVPRSVAETENPSAEVLVAIFSDPSLPRALLDFAEPVDQRLDPSALSASARSTPDGAVIEVTAGAYVRDVVVLADRAHPSASVDRSMVSLLPGESARFLIRADGPLAPEAVLDPRVLRSVNQLLGAPVGTPLR
jgi:beta-mannosidase